MNEVKTILISLIRSVETAIESADAEPEVAKRALQRLRHKFILLEHQAAIVLGELSE